MNLLRVRMHLQPARKNDPREVSAVISMFNLEKLHILLRDFYDLSHIRITVFDENQVELISYPAEVASYCAVIRSVPEGLAACKDCDQNACHLASKRQGTHVYKCHAGLTEAVTPLYVGDVLVGYLLFGHVFSYPTQEEGWDVIRERCAHLSLDQDLLKEKLSHAIPMEESLVRSAAHILHAVASYLILERMATLKEDLMAVRLDSYLSAHFSEKLSAADIADHLEIGKTHLYELSQQLYGCGVAQRIRTLRIEYAKKMLEAPQKYPLSWIASECGFSDYNYFITVFGREVGMSPLQWRKNAERTCSF